MVLASALDDHLQKKFQVGNLTGVIETTSFERLFGKLDAFTIYVTRFYCFFYSPIFFSQLGAGNSNGSETAFVKLSAQGPRALPFLLCCCSL